MKYLHVSAGLKLPLVCIAWVFAFIAKRGAGKTYNAAVLAEEMLKAHVPIVVIDGMGVWWGLRVGANGQGQGYPIVVFGGDHPDLPLVPEKAKEIARAVVGSNISCVLDLSTFSKYMARKVVQEFLDELYRLNRATVRHVFIEEADLWAPQRPIGNEETMCLSAVDNFVRRGGNRNLGCTLITQRSAVLNKNVLTQSDALVVLRTLAPQDKKAIGEWVQEQTETDKRKFEKWYDGLKSLSNGEGWVWHPEAPAIFKKVQFRKRETFHATREFLRTPGFKEIELMDVSEFVAKFRKQFEPKPQAPAPPAERIMNEVHRELQRQPVQAQPTLPLKVTKKELTRVAPLFHPETPMAKPEPPKKALSTMVLTPQKQAAVPAQIPTPEPPYGETSAEGEAVIELEERALVVKITHKEKVVAVNTDELRGQILYTLYEINAQAAPKDVIVRALEHGWNISPPRFSEVAGDMVKEGILVRESSGRYRLPTKVRFELVQEVTA